MKIELQTKVIKDHIEHAYFCVDTRGLGIMKSLSFGIHRKFIVCVLSLWACRFNSSIKKKPTHAHTHTHWNIKYESSIWKLKKESVERWVLNEHVVFHVEMFSQKPLERAKRPLCLFVQQTFRTDHLYLFVAAVFRLLFCCVFLCCVFVFFLLSARCSAIQRP